ncbi:response regulator transcription factor [Aliikangiella marina]|uniref:Response regulator transcription factor n=1 Tax=Aliikangiella marina TaxID=1712262 RepID=A0A545T8U4_9GAMM|nr:response regulator transcription factor [Aliikangiella marina]TQV73636.1 response regulator transcription factor [Aliikangiella marina]
MQTKVIVADDHPLFREAMKQVLPQLIEDCQVIEAESFYQLEQCLADNPDTDLVLMDLHMPGNKGFVGLNLIKSEYPAVAVVMVSATETAQIVHRAFTFGASGYIPKSSPFDVIKTAISSVMLGETWMPEALAREVQIAQSEQDDFAEKITSLTPQQFKVLTMIADGQLNKQIAYDLNIQETTVKHHVSSILRKLNVINRTQAGVLFNQLEVEDSAQQIAEG